MAEPCDFETAMALTGFGRFNFILMVAAFLSAMVLIWDTTALAYVIPLSECELNLSSKDKGTVNAIIYAGLISSSLLWGSVSDTIGRIKLLKYALFVDGVFAFCSAFSPSLWMLLPLRFLVGFMGCTALPLTMTFVAEFHGMKYRSRCIMAVGFYLGAAQVLLPAIGLAMLLESWKYDVGVLTLRPWNVFVMVCALSSLVGSLVFAFLPETPKFLMTHGQNDEALAVMRKMYAMNTGTHPDTYPVERLAEEGEEGGRPSVASVHVLVSRVWDGCHQVATLFSREHVHYTLLVLFIHGCSLISLNTLRLWLPQLFTTLEEFYDVQQLNGNTTSVYVCDAYTAHQQNPEIFRSIVHNISVVPEGTCVPPLKSKKIYINSMIVWSFAAVSLGLSSILVRLLDYKWVIIMCCLLSSVFCLSVLGSTGWTTVVVLFTIYLSTVNIVGTCLLGVVATIFPTKLRATAVCLAMMSGYLSTLIGNLIFPFVLELGCEIPFYLIASVMLEGVEHSEHAEVPRWQPSDRAL